MLANIKRVKTELLAGVECLVQEKNLSYIDAVILYCESNGVDVEQAGGIVGNDKKMTKKIKGEAEDLNFLKRPSVRLSHK
jgi:hypothetical protein